VPELCSVEEEEEEEEEAAAWMFVDGRVPQ